MKSVSRLIETFAPDHYDLSVALHRIERTFTGTVTITGVVANDVASIRLHAKDLTITSVTVDGTSAEHHQEEYDELVIAHPHLKAGRHSVTVGYHGVITDDMNGIYPCYYTVDGVEQEVLATQFESHYARQAFPCIDEPEAKATFDVTITTDSHTTVLGNMPVATQRVEDGQFVTSFQTTPRMSTYLVAWVAGDLQKKTATTTSGVEVSIWSTKAHDPSHLDFALDIATRTIDFFDEYFGVPYPLPKADHVALPDFSAGAMENWGLITYREIALLVDPKTTTLSTKQYAATVIAHELSHQWFGNLVTMKWWNDLWLNESFANMMEYVAIDALEPDWNVWLDFATNEVVSALRRDSLDGVQSIQTEVHHPDEISTIFDPSIVYAKGGRLLRMLQAHVGTEAMRAGLKQYFEKHAYTNTSANDLWSALSETSGKDIASFMNAWMTQPGFPVVHATKRDDTVTLTQQQFFVGPHNDTGRHWPVPLHGASDEIPAMLHDNSVSFTYTDSTPLRLNISGTAHFITQYDAQLFADIVAQLSTLSSVDTVNFLHEQVLLAKAGRQSYSRIIPLLAHFKQETNDSVWSIVALAINELKRFVENDAAAEKKLKDYVGTIVLEQYERLGWSASPNEDENDTKLRSTIISLALYAEIPHATKRASHLFATTSPSALDPELRTAIMAHAVRTTPPTTDTKTSTANEPVEGVSDNIISSLLALYQQTNNSELRDDIAAALTLTKDTATIKRLAQLLKDTRFIRMQDFSHWFVWLLRNRHGRDDMWQWTRDNWGWIRDTFRGDSHYDMFPRYIASALVTREQLREFKAFFSAYESEIALARNITIGYTELDGTVALIESDGPIVRAALLDL